MAWTRSSHLSRNAEHLAKLPPKVSELDPVSHSPGSRNGRPPARHGSASRRPLGCGSVQPRRTWRAVALEQSLQNTTLRFTPLLHLMPGLKPFEVLPPDAVPPPQDEACPQGCSTPPHAEGVTFADPRHGRLVVMRIRPGVNCSTQKSIKCGHRVAISFALDRETDGTMPLSYAEAAQASRAAGLCLCFFKVSCSLVLTLGFFFFFGFTCAFAFGLSFALGLAFKALDFFLSSLAFCLAFLESKSFTSSMLNKGFSDARSQIEPVCF